jgi:protein mraZ
MLSFIGDYTCKLDSKGRLVVPAVFRKEMQAVQEGSFVLQRNIFETCIDVYPKGEWLRLAEELRAKLSPFNQEHMRFRRGFFHGALEVELDANGRILIPRKMLDQVAIEGDEIVLVGLDSKIEIWDKIKYEEGAMSTEEFVLLTDKLNLGNLGL